MSDIASDAVKTRKLCFHGLTPEEIRHITETLQGVARVTVQQQEKGPCVEVSYSLAEHTFEELEQALARNGLPPGGKLAESVKRGLIHYAEEIERQSQPEPTQEARYQQLYAVAEERSHERIEREHPLPPEDLRDYF